MPKRTLAILAAVAFGALALPFGLPTIAHATGPTYASLSIKPLPLEQPGTLSPTGTNTSSICVQPLTSQLKVVPGATVFLSIASGLFTAPPGPGGSATAEGTALTATAQSFIVQLREPGVKRHLGRCCAGHLHRPRPEAHSRA
jgi:hypothetical protein